MDLCRLLSDRLITELLRIDCPVQAEGRAATQAMSSTTSSSTQASRHYGSEDGSCAVDEG